MGCHFLLQGSTCRFLIQGSNPGLAHCGQTLYCLSHQEIQRFPDNQSSFSGTGSSSPSGVWYSAFCTALQKSPTSTVQREHLGEAVGCLESAHRLPRIHTHLLEGGCLYVSACSAAPPKGLASRLVLRDAQALVGRASPGLCSATYRTPMTPRLSITSGPHINCAVFPLQTQDLHQD